MTDGQTSKRELLKKAAYVAPAARKPSRQR